MRNGEELTNDIQGILISSNWVQSNQRHIGIGCTDSMELRYAFVLKLFSLFLVCVCLFLQKKYIYK